MTKILSGRPPTALQGPRKRAPRYYIGNTYRGRLTAAPDAERYKNGVLPGVRNKAARRLIRKASGRALSTIEQKILKARDVRLEIERLATNGHEARRYFEKTLALHAPVPQPIPRSEARARQRAARRAK